jgi:hypothetical protein
VTRSRLLARLAARRRPVGHLLGISDPTGLSLPRVDAARLVTDPLGALGARWDAVLGAAAADLRGLLGVLRDLLAEPSAAGEAVTGTACRPTRASCRWPARPRPGGPAGARRRSGRRRTAVIALRASAAVADLGGGVAGARIGAQAELARIELVARRASSLAA